MYYLIFPFLQIADFGLSKEAHQHPIYATYCGSPLYTAPEILHARRYMGPECDVWSMGVILYTMLTATMPFDDTNFPKFMKKIELGQYSQPADVSDGKQVVACTFVYIVSKYLRVVHKHSCLVVLRHHGGYDLMGMLQVNLVNVDT